MNYRADKLVIDTHTDTQTQAMTIPEGQKLASGKNAKVLITEKMGKNNNLYLCSGLSIRYYQNVYETWSYYCLMVIQ